MYIDNQSYVCVLYVCMYTICQMYMNKAKKYSVYKNLNNDDLKFEVHLQVGANHKQQLFHKPKNTGYLCNTNLS